MTFEQKINNEELFKFIKDFSEQFKGITPGPAFLAGWFKVSIQCIHQKLDKFEREEKILQIKKLKNNVKYIVL